MSHIPSSDSDHEERKAEEQKITQSEITQEKKPTVFDMESLLEPTENQQKVKTPDIWDFFSN